MLLFIQTSLPPDILSWSQQLPSWLWNISIVVITIIIGLVIKFIVTRLFKYYARQEGDYSLFRSMVFHLGVPLSYFIPLVMLNLAIPLLRLQASFHRPLEHIFGIALSLSFASVLISAIKVFEDYVYHVYSLDKTDNLKERKVRTQLQFIRKLLIAVIIFVTIALILLSFKSLREIGTGLLTGVGVGGIIIGFAAQNSLGNLLAGFQIAFTQPIRIDDVLVAEGEWGRVEDITLTYVVMRLWDQRRLILPINYFIQKPFQNWTRISAEIVGSVFLYLDYNTPVNDLRLEFERLMQATPLWDQRVKALQITDSKEHTIEIRMLVSARNSSEAFDLRCYIRENMVNYVQRNHPNSLPKFRTEISGFVSQTKPDIPNTNI
ncbi:mechanosensitive ion channel [Mucilaginibacter robiniae]|uniref:Mechanosensitive ion channel n=1 Tax=Mucilaginibacter robiniae TaxID=2728022 RepID=A0A7L5E7R3_9SPHI|nr:mechanosensitive ion channel domain-containing protein [Mucilaginibacter robiniae]QJD97884.1 mechanosensitive ion channel [Mucilaginibacter robiniae]